jgi:hypothetical protein
MGMHCWWEIPYGLANTDLVAGRKKRRGKPVMKWGRVVKRKKKQQNLTPEDAVIGQIWRKATEKRSVRNM